MVKFSPGFTWGYSHSTPMGLRFLKVPQVLQGYLRKPGANPVGVEFE
jgi:hypothetical protein